jgi:subtilisin family serine protease
MLDLNYVLIGCEYLPKGFDMDVLRIFFIIFFLSGCGSRSNSSESIEKAQDICANAAIPNQKVIRWKNGKTTKHDLRKISKERFESFIKNNQRKIEYVEDNFRLSKPDSRAFSLFGWGGYLNWGTDSISAPTLWKKNLFGQDVTIAIIDSGIDTRHPQLKNQLYVNPNEIYNDIDDDSNGLIDDVHGYDFSDKTGLLQDKSGHGTHIAGIIAAEHEENSVWGVAPKAKLIVFDFFTDDGDGSVFDAIAAIEAARAAGAKIINASWGGPGCSRSLEEVVNQLAKHNILFVTAAGNESSNIDRIPSFPASYSASSLIAVGAMTADNLTAGFSNFGQKVHLVAPGANIVSTYPLPEGLAIEHGTSMAAPFVSGAAALLWSAFPQATALQIKTAMISSIDPGFYPVLSRGSLNVAAAHENLSRQFNQR